MSEYFIPNFEHKYAVYLKLNTPVYQERIKGLSCVYSKNPGLADSDSWTHSNSLF